jgi:hypothetical protein
MHIYKIPITHTYGRFNHQTIVNNLEWKLRYILSKDRSIKIKGRVMYNDRRRRIDVKKPIRDLFNSSENIGYIMELCLSEKKLQERINELSNKCILPVLLYFTEEK